MFQLQGEHCPLFNSQTTIHTPFSLLYPLKKGQLSSSIVCDVQNSFMSCAFFKISALLICFSFLFSSFCNHFYHIIFNISFQDSCCTNLDFPAFLCKIVTVRQLSDTLYWTKSVKYHYRPEVLCQNSKTTYNFI